MPRSMGRLDFSLKLLTPCYMAGADQEAGAPETLRVPALRGALRFWYRASELTESATDLYERESRIFGSAERGQGVRIVPVGGPVRPASDQQSRSFRQKYLGYGAASESKRRAIAPGVTFSYRALGNAEQLAGLRRALLLLHLFGGLGARSRRGWGAVEVTTRSGEPVVPAAEGPGFARWMEGALARVWPDGTGPAARREEPEWTSFSSSSRLVCVGPFRTWTRAFDDLFERFQTVKAEGREPAAEGEAPPRVRLGLPWAFGDPPKSYLGQRGQDKVDRRASPLCLSLCAYGNETYATLLFLGGRFFRKGTDLVQKPGGPSPEVALPDAAPIRDLFLDAPGLDDAALERHEIAMP